MVFRLFVEQGHESRFHPDSTERALFGSPSLRQGGSMQRATAMAGSDRRSGTRGRKRRLPTDPSVPRFSPERAFVVQLEIRRPVNRPTLRGRVEHLVTGQAFHFGSAAELIDFMSRFRGGAR